MTDFAIRYSYFDRVLGHSGHGEAIGNIQCKSDGEGEGEGESEGKGEGESEGEGEAIDLDDPHHREAIEQHIKEALTHEYPEHHHGHLVVLVLTCSQVPHLEGESS